MSRRLSVPAARRLALAAQGFGRARPGTNAVRTFRRALSDMAVVQLDSVNVLARSHYLPFFARLGPYDTAALDRWLWRSRENFEYLMHEAAVGPVDLYPLMAFRRRSGRWQLGVRLERERGGYVAAVLDEVRLDGPLSIKELTDPGERTGPWWGYGDGKLALEWLYVTGRLAIHERSRNFVTYYDIPERVVPAAVLAQPEPPVADARRELVRRAAAALGVATLADLADYFRQRALDVRPVVAELVRAGELEEVAVDGWRDIAYVPRGASVPRRLAARALLSPFDPVVWFRPRAERLFGFHYRIEIYVPAPKRVYGYYVLPFLLGDQLVARVDLKTDRSVGALCVRGAYAEAGQDPAVVAPALAATLQEMAQWLGMGDVAVEPRGDLAGALANALA